MNKSRAAIVMGTLLVATTVLGACGSSSSEPAAEGSTDVTQAPKAGESTQAPAVKEEANPFPISLVINQVGEIPSKGNPMEQAIMKYTNTTLDIQWIPQSAYDEKVNVMIASSELPKLIKLNYIPTIVNALKSDLFWEIGPYLKDYKNLSAQPDQYYKNISVDGKIYGVPLFRDIGRAAIHYRKDWYDAAGLKPPVKLEDWYTVIKAMTDGDPDKNSKKDTYGMMLDKNYNQGAASTLTRLSVAQGGPNKWKVDDQGNFTPEFMTDEFLATMKLFQRLYKEQLINQDFAVVDATQIDKVFESGRSALRISGGNAQSMQTKVEKVDANAVVDAAALEGPNGIRVPGESGNAGFLAIPKSSVKSEEDMKRVLAFVDQLMDKEMSNLIVKGVEGTHYKVEGDFTVPLDKDLESKEVKPYRDTLPHRGENYNIDKPSKETDLFNKNKKIVTDNEQYAVPNPALILESAIYTERGKELEQLITDAQTKFIMGKLDEAGWLAEVEKWRKAGGDKLMEEYKESYLKSK